MTAKPAAKKAKKSAKKPVSPKASKAAPESDVSAFMEALTHPLKKEIEAVRKAILSVDKKITEGVKWNSVSFRTDDYFATVNLRSRDELQLVFHRGAKVKTDGKKLKIDDRNGLIKWLSDDRCLITLGEAKAVKANMPAFKRIVAEWIKQL